MKIIHRLITALLLFGIGCSIAHAETIFTYQGKLGSAGQPAEGAHDFRFRLFDAETGGTQAGSQLAVSPVAVSSGVFTVQLDFGDAPFNSSPRWLEIDVREVGAGAYTTLAPRQRVGASPFAIETVFVGPGAVDTAALQDNSVTTTKIANGNVFTDDLANFAVSTGKLSNQAVTRLKIADDAIGTSQIENNTVTGTDINEGSIAPIDIGPGLYRSRGDLYENAGIMISIGATPRNFTVSCADANDLPVTGGCRVGVANQYIATSVAENDWALVSNVFSASVTCSGVNIHPSDPAGHPVTVQAYIVCVNVP
jgi:hypothetical protein